MLLVVLGLIFGGTIIIGVPIAFSIGIAALAGIVLLDAPMQLAVLKYYSQLDIFSLMAIPFFILAGELMNIAGITRDLLNFADMLVGRFHGGLAQITVLASAVFASITGSATSAASTLGTTLIPKMEEKGYDRDFSCGVVASASILGPIIPPSITMIMLGMLTGTSVATLFVAGFIPGLIIAFGLMVVVYIIAKKKNYPRREERLSLKEIIIRGFRALPALFMPVVILGGVFAGVVSVTEASAVAVGYAFFYGLIKQPRVFFKGIWGAVSRAVNVSVMILTVVGCAGIIIWVLATDMSAQQLADSFLKFSRNPYIFLLFINILYLILGCLLETGASIFLTIPLLFPIATKLGIDPVHFNLIVTINLCIGFITPPVGLCLYVLCGITKLPLERVARSVVPFLVVEVAVLFLVTYVPDIALVLPRLVGMIK